MGFLQICAGVILLQLSKSAKDVPDAAVFSGDLDQVRTVVEQKEPEYEPKADAIRGAAAVIRRISVSRQKMEAEEARRLHEERMRDLEPIGEGEQFEWDGLRRRRTTSGSSGNLGSLQRRKTRHPPLGMSHFTHEPEEYENGNSSGQTPNSRSPMHPVPLTTISVVPPLGADIPAEQSNRAYPNAPPLHEHHQYDLGMVQRREMTSRQNTPIRWAPEVGIGRTQSPETPPKPPPHVAKRQFSFQNVFHRNRDNQQQTHDGAADGATRPRSRLGLSSHQSSHAGQFTKVATEEEQLGLVRGDSSTVHQPPLPEYVSSEEEDEDWRKGPKSEWSHGDEKEPDTRRWSEGSNGSSSMGTGLSHRARDSRESKDWEGRSEKGGAFV